MEALNKNERKQAISSFAMIYGLSMVVPFVAAYFLFSSPTGDLKNENDKLRNMLDEQVKLNKNLETVVMRLNILSQADKSYVGSTNDIEKGTLKSTIEESENVLKSTIYQIKTDTANIKIPANQKLSKNVVTMMDAALTYRNTISYLRQLLDKNGINTEEIDKLKAEMMAKDDKISMMDLMLKQRPAPVASSGGGGKDCSQIESQLNNAQAEIARLKGGNGSSKPTTPSSTSSSTYSDIGEQANYDFAMFLIRKADDRKRIPCARKPLYELALEKLSSSQKPDAKGKIDEVNNKLKSLSD